MIYIQQVQQAPAAKVALGFTYKISKKSWQVSKIKPGGWAEKVCANTSAVMPGRF
jgi:hypothetical protein